MNTGPKIWNTYPSGHAYAMVSFGFFSLSLYIVKPKRMQTLMPSQDYHQVLRWKQMMTYFKQPTLMNYQSDQKTLSKWLSMMVYYFKFYNIPHKAGKTVQVIYQSPFSLIITESITEKGYVLWRICINSWEIQRTIT